ncbi:hypothetical protein [Nannocystis pusilla]|uniref:Peptidase M1 membrane alanine aminopeptidase domain-containing protein n=1 Tax=Nannocystis pusilla TaxID=889268 RepID=A0ABS7U6F7_9BACT|nr:hypothetical protein [Nannocystis pusilla]MBZ5715991.1 hypothetical protein [Nannocystis pusilla]
MTARSPVLSPCFTPHDLVVPCLAAALLLPACGADGTATDTADPGTSTSEGTSTETTAPTTTDDLPVETTEEPTAGDASTTSTATTVDETTAGITDTTDDPTASSSTGDSTSTGGEDTSTSTGDTSTSTGDTSTGDTDEEPPGDCDALVHAPPSATIDGLDAVPIDIVSLDAQMSFDAAAAQAQVAVTMNFRLGPEGGMPIFDLRQTIATATLDGEPLAPAAMGSHDFGKGLMYGFRILEQELEACSEHTLALTYAMTLPAAPNATGFQWLDAPDGVYFDISLSDLNPGRYLESYLPANFPFDRHPVSLGVTVSGAGQEHVLFSNGDVEQLGDHEWQLEFPDSTTAMAPLVMLLPSSAVTTVSGVHAAVNGQNIPYTIYRHTSTNIPIETLETDLVTRLDEFVTSTGDYPHPAMTALIGGAMRSMEYDGATTTKPQDLAHEVFHSWWARGAHPATYADGWIDEAWTEYNTRVGMMFTEEPFDWNAAPVLLFDPHPFARDTPDNAYTAGRRLFAGLAAILGVDALRAGMAELYGDVGPLGSVTTAQLERHLYCAGGEQAEVRQAFWRFAHAEFGQVPAAPADYCDP